MKYNVGGELVTIPAGTMLKVKPTGSNELPVAVAIEQDFVCQINTNPLYVDIPESFVPEKENGMLKKVISGGQTGADYGGLMAAKKANIETGGWMPNGFKNENGKHPDYAEIYNIQEHSSPKYPPRTYANVRDSDGTIRFAYDFDSAGEECTLKAINQYKKPHFDVNVENPPAAEDVVKWIQDENIEILNVAGNRESTYNSITIFTLDYLTEVFEKLND